MCELCSDHDSDVVAEEVLRRHHRSLDAEPPKLTPGAEAQLRALLGACPAASATFPRPPLDHATPPSAEHPRVDNDDSDGPRTL